MTQKGFFIFDIVVSYEGDHVSQHLDRSEHYSMLKSSEKLWFVIF